MRKHDQQLSIRLPKTLLDALECSIEEISRTSSDQTKSQKQKSFTEIASQYVKDQRDVILVAIKIR